MVNLLSSERVFFIEELFRVAAGVAERKGKSNLATKLACSKGWKILDVTCQSSTWSGQRYIKEQNRGIQTQKDDSH